MINNEQTRTLFLSDEQASIQWADKLAEQLQAPFVMTLSGDLGAGKTTIVRAMLRTLGIQCAIKSPTFSLVESYSCARFSVHHFDLYRIHHEDELEYIGFRDFFSSQAICCIEWAEHAGSLLPMVDLSLTLTMKGTGRALEMTAYSVLGQGILALLS